METVQTT